LGEIYSKHNKSITTKHKKTLKLEYGLPTWLGKENATLSKKKLEVPGCFLVLTGDYEKMESPGRTNNYSFE